MTVDTHLALAAGLRAWARPDPELGWEGAPIVAENAEELAGFLLDGSWVDDAVTDGTALIAAERQRQIEAEGWTPEHDAEHTAEQLAWAAACYAAPETVYRVEMAEGRVAWREPWPVEWWPNVNRGVAGYLPWRRPKTDRVRELVKAGALIAAEIDRLRRA